MLPTRNARLRQFLISLLPLVGVTSSPLVLAAGTPAGTIIENAVQVSFDLGGSAQTVDSNTTSITVAERIDVSVIPLSPQAFVSPRTSNSSLLFRVTNIGNGSETFALQLDSNVVGDDFDPVPAAPAIYFDTDASGDLSPADTAYVPGNNDPTLAADAAIDVLVVNDIPAAVTNGQIGRSEFTVRSLTGNGAPGDPFPNQGDGGVDALVGASGGLAAEQSEYVGDDVQINVVKTVAVLDPFGGSEPVTGATLTYTITIEVANSGVATASTFVDPIPTNTSFVNSSLSLNGSALTDAVADDAGELDTTAAPTVVVRLGDLTQASGVQTVSFDVVID